MKTAELELVFKNKNGDIKRLAVTEKHLVDNVDYFHEALEECDCTFNESSNHCEGDCLKYTDYEFSHVNHSQQAQKSVSDETVNPFKSIEDVAAFVSENTPIAVKSKRAAQKALTRPFTSIRAELIYTNAISIALWDKLSKHPDKEESKCRECGGAGKASKGLKNKFVGSNDDFGNDAGQEGTTMSLGKDADLIDCLKCIDCGHSWV